VSDQSASLKSVSTVQARKEFEEAVTLPAEAVLRHPPLFASSSGQTLRSTIVRRLRLHWNSGSDLLQVANDDPVTFTHALVYDNRTAIAAPGETMRCSALPSLPTTYVNEPAELARAQRDLWHQHHGDDQRQRLAESDDQRQRLAESDDHVVRRRGDEGRRVVFYFPVEAPAPPRNSRSHPRRGIASAPWDARLDNGIISTRAAFDLAVSLRP
jgi:hypothetical protein